MLLLRLLVVAAAAGLLLHAGYEGTFVCEPDRKKALQMYKEWKAGNMAPVGSADD